MSAADFASRVLLGLGTAVIVASCIGALVVGTFYDRLHFVTPVTSLGLPLIGLAMAISSGWGETTAQILLTVFFVALSGPVLTAANGRVAAQRDGLVERDSPQ